MGFTQCRFGQPGGYPNRPRVRFASFDGSRLTGCATRDAGHHRAFRAAGAVSPATARPLADLPGVDGPAAVAMAARGWVREASPGHYSLLAGTEHERRQRLLTAVRIAAASAATLVGLPVAAWLATR